MWQSKNEFIVSSHSDFTGLRYILRPIFYRSIRFPEHHLLCSFNYCASTVIRPFFKIAIHFCTICSGFFESFWQMQQLVVDSSSFLESKWEFRSHPSVHHHTSHSFYTLCGFNLVDQTCRFFCECLVQLAQQKLE